MLEDSSLKIDSHDSGIVGSRQIEGVFLDFLGGDDSGILFKGQYLASVRNGLYVVLVSVWGLEEATL